MPRPKSSSTELLRPSSFLFFSLTLLALGTNVSWLLEAPILDAECKRYILSVQEGFGFQAGPMVATGPDSFGILHVIPNGAFAAAGFWDGDIPVAYHGGLGDFCYALTRAKEGKPTEMTVINVAEWSDGWSQARTIAVPPPLSSVRHPER